MLRPRLRIPRIRVLRPSFQRQLHERPLLGKGFSENGVPGLLSPGGYDIGWTQNMNNVLERLNRLTNGTEYAQVAHLKDVVLATSREPHLAATFNYASYAHNNHFFFEGLSAKEEPDPIPERLERLLLENFNSIETLRRELILTAQAMFGPGFVWLVKNAQTTQLRVLVTYLAGSPYSGAHWRRQGVDMATRAGASSGNDATVAAFLERTAAGVHPERGNWAKNAPGNLDVVPLLCVNTWEHIWLRDYGMSQVNEHNEVEGGKRAFLEAWWHCIDWNRVLELAEIDRRALK